MLNGLPKVMLNLYRVEVVFQHSNLISAFILLLCTSFEQEQNKTQPGFFFFFSHSLFRSLQFFVFFSLESNAKMEISTKEKSETL